jgi:hypothetical protein
MQQLVFQLFVAIHGQDQLAGRANNAASALDEGPVIRKNSCSLRQQAIFVV